MTYDGLLEPLGSSQVLPYVRGLKAAGHPMEILSFEKSEDLHDGARVEKLRARLKGEGIPWTPLRYHQRPTLPATAWDMWAGRRHVRAWARRAPSPGILHARGYVPGLMGLPAQDFGHRLLFDMRGFWVDERIEGGYWPAGGARVAVGRWVERTVLGRADHLILLTQRAAHRLKELAPPGASPPWTVIPTCVDLERFRPAADVAAARREVGLGAGPVLLHTGTLTGWYDGAATLAVGKAFEARTGGSFVILTRDVSAAQDLAARVGMSPMIRTVSHEEMPRWLAAADAGLALVRPSPSKDASFPTKVAEYLASGLAVVGTAVGDMHTLADPGALRLMDLAAGPGAVDDAADWLAEVVGDSGRVGAARALAEAHLGLATGVSRLTQAYASMSGAGSAT